LFVTVIFSGALQLSFFTDHYYFCEMERNPAQRGRREAIAAPRGHAKTTFKVIFKVSHAIVYDYEKFVVIMGHSAPEADAKVRDILDELGE
jgi:hypothetical protein